MVDMNDRILLPFHTIDGLRWADRRFPEGLHVVRDTDGWTRLSALSTAHHSPQPPVPAVNWQTEMCVVVAVGSRSNGGYTVLIDVIEIMDGRMTVLAWEIRPGPGCIVTRAITYPFHAVVAPTHAAEPRLIKRIAYEDCESADNIR